MYEDYLEEFIYKTAKSVAKKLFCLSTDATEDVALPSSNLDGSAIKEIENVCETEESVPTEQSAISSTDEPVEISEEERLADEQLNNLLKEAFEKQKENELEKLKTLAEQRAEYDGIHDAISNINFHMGMFMLLIVLTALNLPSVISWAKNYRYVLFV